MSVATGSERRASLKSSIGNMGGIPQNSKSFSISPRSSFGQKYVKLAFPQKPSYIYGYYHSIYGIATWAFLLALEMGRISLFRAWLNSHRSDTKQDQNSSSEVDSGESLK